MKIATLAITKPPRFVIYGPQGVGKTRLAASFPKPFFVRLEDRHEHLAGLVQTHEGSIVKTLAEFKEILDWLLTEEHDFKTVVLDTIDSGENIIHKEICRLHGTTDILDAQKLGFYSGYVKAAKLWESEILERLWLLNTEKKMIPVLISHVQMKDENHPELGHYLKASLGCDKRLAARILKLADIVMFMDWETMQASVPGDDTKKEQRLVSSGQRILRIKPHPFLDSKESYNLPEKLELPEEEGSELQGYKIIQKAIVAGIKKNKSGDLAKASTEQDNKRLGAKE